MKNSLLLLSMLSFFTSSAQEEVNENLEQEESYPRLALLALKEATFDSEEDQTPVYDYSVSPYLSYGLINTTGNTKYKVLSSDYLEFGIVVRTPFSKYNNLYGLKYGLSYSSQSLTLDNKYIFQDRQGNIEKVKYPTHNTSGGTLVTQYINLPIALDFDFSEKKYNHANRRFFTNHSWKFGVGGYLSFNVNAYQNFSYTENDYEYTIKQDGDWQTPNIRYGAMIYSTLSGISLVAKYDLSPLFRKNSFPTENVVSIGMSLFF